MYLSEGVDSRGVTGVCDNAPAPNTAARFMSVYEASQRAKGLLQDLLWITAAFRRSTPVNSKLLQPKH